MYGELDISKFEVGPCIGRGATSEVLHGIYNGIGGRREVALKFLMKGCKGHDVQKEFRRESQILVKLIPHPNVVKMIGVVGPCMVLEFCNKGSLYGVLHDPQCPITWAKVWDIAIAVARGMSHLHNYRIIHRDLKPGNLMVHEQDGTDHVKIADFGLSRNLLANSPMTAGLGTWQYSAPEVLSEENYSQKADVYSYGMVIWEACTRTEPYCGQPPAKAMSAIMAGRTPEMPPLIPPSLRELLQSCMSKDPTRRPHFKRIVTMLENLKPSLERIKHTHILLPHGHAQQT